MKIFPHTLGGALLMASCFTPSHADGAEAGLAVRGPVTHPLQLSPADLGGKPLAAPWLIVPGDRHAGRAVAKVVSMEIR